MPGEQLLLINPRRRKRAKNSRRHRKARHAGGFRIKRRRHKNPKARRSYGKRRHRNPRRSHRRHRNPMSMSGIKGALVPAAFGALGGVALDVGYNFLAPYIPASVTGISPYMPNVLKLAGAFGIGMAARKALGSEKGNAVMAGALTIQIYNILASLMGGTPGMAGLGAYLRPTIAGGLGSPNPAAYLQRPMGRMGRMGKVGAYMPNAMPLSGLPFAGLAGTASEPADMMF